MRGKRKLGLAVLVAAAAGALFGAQPATAATSTAPQPDTDRVAHLVPETGMRSAGSGGHTGDLTGDGLGDIVARCACSGGLGRISVYPNSGTFDGLATYPTVYTLNHGWAGMRWMGSADLTGDGFADVLGIDGNTGTLVAARHSGTFNGPNGTLENGLVTLGWGWETNDLVYVADINGDGFDDLLGRRAGTGDTYVYVNTGGQLGTAIFQAPQLFVSGGDFDVWQGLADVNLDGVLDLMFVQDNGVLGVLDLANGWVDAIGWGWEGIDAVVLTDVNGDGAPDLLGRNAANGNLQAYAHVATWDRANPYATYRAPVVVGYGWHINDIIT